MKAVSVKGKGYCILDKFMLYYHKIEYGLPLGVRNKLRGGCQPREPDLGNASVGKRQ